MSERQTLKFLRESLGLDDWWKDFVDHKTVLTKPDIDKVTQLMPYMEITAAKEIARKMDHQLSYDAATETWYAWNGIIHVPCVGNGMALQITKILWESLSKALSFVQEYYENEAAKIKAQNTPTSDQEAAAMLKSYEVVFGSHRYFRDRIASEAGISALSRLLRTECNVDEDHFADDTQWFVMRNWVLDLEALKAGNWVLHPHSPKRNVTKYFDADYPDDPSKANLGHWDNYLKKSIPDETQRTYLQTAVGAGFTGIGKLRAIISIVGPPGTGKSLFLDAIGKLGSQGAKYTKKPSGSSIMQAKGTTNFGQDEFRGARFVYISEPPSTGRVDDDFLKGITGDGDVATRTLNKKESAWNPQCLLCIASNASLKIDIRDDAIVERVQQINFPVKFYPQGTPGIPDDQIQIRGLDQLILRDRSRVLMWIIAGMRRFINDGMVLTPPDSVVVARDKVRSDGSTALRWALDAVEEGLIAIDFNVPKSHWVTVGEAYENYKMWCYANGEKQLSSKFFSKDIQARYGEVVPSGGKRFQGLLKTDVWLEKYDNAWMRN